MNKPIRKNGSWILPVKKSRAVIYPVFSRAQLKFLCVVISGVIALSVLFLPASIQECGKDCLLLNWLFLRALDIPAIEAMRTLSALPLPMAIGYLCALFMGSLVGILICFTSGDIDALSRQLGTMTTLKRVLVFIVACVLYAVLVLRNSDSIVNHPWKELGEILRTSRVWLVIFCESLFGLSSVLVPYIVIEIVGLFGKRR